MKVRYFEDTDTMLLNFSEHPIIETKDLNEDRPNDVFVFAGKMIDIGTSRGYIFTTSDAALLASLTETKVLNLSRSK